LIYLARDAESATPAGLCRMAESVP
jgi:hypothetical protein